MCTSNPRTQSHVVDAGPAAQLPADNGHEPGRRVPPPRTLVLAGRAVVVGVAVGMLVAIPVPMLVVVLMVLAVLVLVVVVVVAVRLPLLPVLMLVGRLAEALLSLQSLGSSHSAPGREGARAQPGA